MKLSYKGILEIRSLHTTKARTQCETRWWMNASELILNDDGSIYHLGIRPSIVPLSLSLLETLNEYQEVSIFDRIDFRTYEEKFVFILASWETNL